MTARLFLLTAILVTGLSSASAQNRTWTDSKGKTVEARFVRVHNGAVILMQGQKVLRVPFDQLGAKDQQFLREKLSATGQAGLLPPAQAAGEQRSPSGQEPADVPAPKHGAEGKVEDRFQSLHESFLKRGKEGKIGVLFLGDSITEGWGGAKNIWDEHFSKYDPANFGISGDRTQHVLWRIENGELDGISPKVVVLMIGTNNSGYPAEEIIAGDKTIIEEIHEKLPDAKLLLLGIFPRGATADDPARAKIKAVNAELAKLDDGAKTRYLDIGDKFLDANGNLPQDVMPDALHPNAKGYQIWADAMQPLLDEMMR